jgi:hypothetical protein
MQLLLKQHERIMVAAERPREAWAWRLCRLLHINVAHMAAATRQANSRESLAVPLRTVEVFTSWEICQHILGESKVTQLCQIEKSESKGIPITCSGGL